MSLLPASGFQSAQYRKIEIRSTTFNRLLNEDHRDPNENYQPGDIESLYPHIYWKAGAVELASGKKTLTLRQFEVKYDRDLLELAENTSRSTSAPCGRRSSGGTDRRIEAGPALGWM